MTCKMVISSVCLPFLVVLTFTTMIACQPASKVSPTQILLNGQPSWFPLGGEVYQERNCTEAEKEVLAFTPEPRWFLGYSKSASMEEYNAFKEDPRQHG